MFTALSIMYPSLGFDHRLIAGTLADQFTATIKAGLENFPEDIPQAIAG